jgi:hypothetical protein
MRDKGITHFCMTKSNEGNKPKVAPYLYLTCLMNPACSKYQLKTTAGITLTTYELNRRLTFSSLQRFSGFVKVTMVTPRSKVSAAVIDSCIATQN